jgi:hypothetical protein
MVLGVSIFHVLVLIVQLVSIALPFVQIVHARHAKALGATIGFLTLVCCVCVLRFGTHISTRSDLVLLRCYAFSSALCSLADELLSARDAEKPMRFLILLPFGLLFLLALGCLLGGISGIF